MYTHKDCHLTCNMTGGILDCHVPELTPTPDPVPLSSYVVLEFVEISHACFCTPCLAVFLTHFSQLDLNVANLETTVEAE